MKYARSLTAGLAMTLACAFAQEADAASLKQGECKPYAEMVETLKAEGQHSLIWAKRWTEDDNLRPDTIVTANDNGTVGYQFIGENVAGADTPPEKLCVLTILTDVRLHDPYSKMVPETFRIEASISDEAIEQAVIEKKLDASGDHNRVLTTAASNGIIPALQARVVNEKGLGPIFTLTVDTRDNLMGGTSITREDGLMTGLSILQNVRLTERFEEELRNGGPRVASLSLANP